MKTIKTIQKEVEIIEGIQCDKCKTEFTNDLDLEEMICIEHQCGYSSIFGDGDLIKIDLCQHCFRLLLGEFVTIIT